MRHSDRSNFPVAKILGLALVLAVLVVGGLGGAFYHYSGRRGAAKPVSAAATGATPAPTPAATPPPANGAATWGPSAAEFLKDAPFSILLHTDTLMLLTHGRRIENAAGLQVSLPAIRAGQVGAFAAALFVPTADRNAGRIDEYCRRAPLTLNETIAQHPDILREARSVADLRKNWQDGRVSVLRSVEGSWCLGGGLERLPSLFNDGVRMIGLTWRADNRLAMSWENGGDHGLTPLGEAAVRKMIELGVLVDVSHMNDASIRGVLDIAAQMKAPVVASHSNCRALCNHPRNLPDDLIKRIADSGGVIGVNFYSPFLRAGGAAAIADVVRHLAHLRDVGGIGCAALGTDYDGLESRQPAELKTAAGLVRLRQSLKQAGFSDVDIAAIFGGNFVRALTLAENRAGEIAIRAHGATPAGR